MNNFEVITLNEPGINDFASARNKLLKNSKAEWLLFLDTDEKLSESLAREIKDLNPGGYNGFVIKRKIIFLGEAAGEDAVLRLARRTSGQWKRKVHETWRVKGNIGMLDGYIIHNTADNLHDYIGKINSYSSIHAAENIREGKHSNLFKILLFPKLKFIQNMMMGRGFAFSMLQSFHSFLGWAKEWESTRKTGQAK